MAADAAGGGGRLRALDARLLPALPVRLRRRWLYLRVHRRVLRLSPPRTFTEKVNWRILHDRRPELVWTCDKVEMKERARSSGADVHVPQTLWTGVDLADLDLAALPGSWVLKPSHRSGLVHFGGPGDSLEELQRLTRGWLADVQTDTYAEWAYGQARRQLLIEEMVGDPGSPPADYKFFVFHGEPHLVQVDVSRFSGHRRALYTPDWRKLDVRLNYPDAGEVPAPPNLDRMLEAARVLATDWDFMRVDLYSDSGRVVFGEYSPYPSSGLERFAPADLDVELGARWRLPPEAAVAQVGA